MNFKNKAAWKEALIDTAIGTALNFPLNMLAMWIIFKLQLTVFQSSVLLWFLFTVIALVRKYALRVYFENKLKNKS
jgi:hypothetical protein